MVQLTSFEAKYDRFHMSFLLFVFLLPEMSFDAHLLFRINQKLD